MLRGRQRWSRGRRSCFSRTASARPAGPTARSSGSAGFAPSSARARSRGAAAVADEIVRLSREFTGLDRVRGRLHAGPPGAPRGRLTARRGRVRRHDDAPRADRHVRPLGLPRHRCGRRHRTRAALPLGGGGHGGPPRALLGNARGEPEDRPGRVPRVGRGLEPPRPALRSRSSSSTPTCAASGGNRVGCSGSSTSAPSGRASARSSLSSSSEAASRTIAAAAALMTGTYIGGTVNLVALSAALSPLEGARGRSPRGRQRDDGARLRSPRRASGPRLREGDASRIPSRTRWMRPRPGSP